MPLRDTFQTWRILENIDAVGGEGEWYLPPTNGAQLLRCTVYINPDGVGVERIQSFVAEGLNRIGEDAAALAEAQAALAIPAPVDPGDIAHNDLGSLQGGNGVDEYYHLTAAEHTNVGNLDTAAYEPTSSFDAAGDADAAVAAHVTTPGAHAASNISFAPTLWVASGNVEDAIDEVGGNIGNHLADTSGAHAASAISFTPVGTIAATDAQAAVAEVATDAAAALAAESASLQGNIDDEATARATADANHVAAADPHTQYQKESEKDAANGYLGADANARLTSTKLQVSATDRLIGRDTASAGASEEITVGGGLEFTGTGGIQRSALTGDVTATAGSGATGIANGVVSLAMMKDLATDRLIGRDTAGTGVPEALTVGGGVEFSGSGGIQRSALTGDVTASAGSNSTTIATAAVTLAKMADLATDKVIGRVSSGTGVPEAVTFTDLAQTLAALTTAQAFCAAILSGYMIAQSTVQDAIGATTSLTKHGVTILIPGGSIGANGSVRVEALFGHNSSANSKRHVIQIHTSDAVGGTTLQDVTATTTAFTVMVADIGNQNATNSQRFRLGATYAGSGGSANTTSALNTANDLYIVLASQKITSSSDTATLDNYRVWINYKA